MFEEMPAESRKRIEARAAELIAEHLTLTDLRKARARTQSVVAKKLKIGQDSVSRVEKRSDLLLSTLRHYVAALGGELELVVHFKDRPPVVLEGLAGDMSPSPRSIKGKGVRTAA
jgi:transcriptional regulator with XRE-family HTH domain